MLIRNLPLITLALVAGTQFASAADRTADYNQVRAIALRDPKVRAAYAAADRKLQERIVEIDPTLKGYPNAAPASKPAPANAPKPKTAEVKPAAPKPAQPKPAAKPVAKEKPVAYKRSHVVAKGETLGNIAAKYRVTVDELMRVNEIRNPRRLPAGQVLAIPNSSAKAQPTRKTAASKEKTWWEQLQGGM